MSRLRITVAWSPAPREVVERELTLDAPASVADALRACGLGEALRLGPEGAFPVGVWGRKAQPSQALRDQDRVELYRGLQVDPKVARRERFQRQGSRSTGLFARKRPGAKAGY